MQFEKGYIYHIYNQGNNRQKLFFNRGNYLYFLEKIWKYVVPYCGVLAYCLMPNHFHLMVLVNELSIPTNRLGASPTNRLGASSRRTESKKRERTLNASIGIMLMSYSKAINKQQKRTGKLFREETKAECINCPNGITPSFYSAEFGTQIHVSDPAKEYPQACFNYIHQNPVNAGLVSQMEEWEYSSYKDYAGYRNGKLVDKELASSLGASPANSLGASLRRTETEES
jgi:putative transposase